MLEYTSDEKKKKKEMNILKQLYITHKGNSFTPTHSHKRGERKGEKEKGREERETFQPRNKLSLFLYHKTTRRDECAPNLAVLQNHFINI